MKGIRFSQAIVALFVVALGTTYAMAAYDVGFVWNRYNDWVPGTSDHSSAGNPCKDAAGNPVWSHEYILNVPAGADLDTSDGVAPWYTLPSSGLMAWDSHWAGGTWAQDYDYAPLINRTWIAHIAANQSYYGNAYPRVPLLRWQNPCSIPIEVSLKSGSSFLGAIGTLMPTGTLADIIIARTDASDGDSVHLLYSQTIEKTYDTNTGQYIVLDPFSIESLSLDPGDDILFSVRSRGFVNTFEGPNVNLGDDVTITVVPEPATLGILGLGGLALLRRRRRK